MSVYTSSSKKPCADRDTFNVRKLLYMEPTVRMIPPPPGVLRHPIFVADVENDPPSDIASREQDVTRLPDRLDNALLLRHPGRVGVVVVVDSDQGSDAGGVAKVHVLFQRHPFGLGGSLRLVEFWIQRPAVHPAAGAVSYTHLTLPTNREV